MDIEYLSYCIAVSHERINLDHNTHQVSVPMYYSVTWMYQL